MTGSFSESFILFNRQLSSTLALDLPLPESLQRVAAELEEPALKENLLKIAAEIERGGGFSEALALHGSALPPVYIALVRAGEAGGNLGEALATAAAHDERMLALENQVRSGLIYPALLAAGAAGLTLLFSFWVLPTLSAFMREFHTFGKLPIATKLLFAAGSILGHPLFWAAAAAAGAWAFKSRGRIGHWLAARQFRVPVWRDFMGAVFLARFCRTMASLLQGGVGAPEALALTRATMRAESFETALKDAEAAGLSGEKLSAALGKSPLFPRTLVWMLGAAEDRGDVAACLRELGDYYQQAAGRRAGMISKLLEPVLISIMGLFIGAVVLSFFLPMFSFGSLVE